MRLGKRDPMTGPWFPLVVPGVRRETGISRRMVVSKRKPGMEFLGKRFREAGNYFERIFC